MKNITRALLGVALVVSVVGVWSVRFEAQAPVTSTQGLTAIKAGRLFDPKSGTNLMNQVVLVKGDQIVDVGAAARVQIPAGARVIDLSQATVLPGLIDGHVHLNAAKGTKQQALDLATASLGAGFTTLVVQGAHGGGYNDVELKKDIERGIVKGPRLITAGPIVGSDELPAKGAEGFRAAVGTNHDHGVDHIKIITTGQFAFDPKSGCKMTTVPAVTREELAAAVDEAHRLGMWTATHTYGGQDLKWAIDIGVDTIQHAMGADDADIKMIKQKDLPIQSNILNQRQDEPGDLKKFAPCSRWRAQEAVVKKMMAAGIRQGFASGATPVVNGAGRIYNQACQCSHGVQGEMFAVFVQWGATPAYALRMATSVNAVILKKQDTLGTIDKGKFADIIAVAGDPLKDITEMQRVKFVMKGGDVIKNQLSVASVSSNR